MGDRRPVPGSTLVGAAVGLVIGCAVLFSVIGMLRGDDGVTVDDVAAEASPTPAASSEPVDDVTDEPSDEPATAAPSPAASPSPAPSPEPSSEPTETVSPAATQVDPGSITIQVLDAVGAGDATAAQSVAAELRAAGFNVVVVNRAGRVYDVTTVFWSPGQEDAGRTVAAALGTSRAEETPSEVQLSSSVAVHVVVGTDRS